jgi:hypothetical protein
VSSLGDKVKLQIESTNNNNDDHNIDSKYHTYQNYLPKSSSGTNLNYNRKHTLRQSVQENLNNQYLSVNERLERRSASGLSELLKINNKSTIINPKYSPISFHDDNDNLTPEQWYSNIEKEQAALTDPTLIIVNKDDIPLNYNDNTNNNNDSFDSESYDYVNDKEIILNETTQIKKDTKNMRQVTQQNSVEFFTFNKN